MKANNRCRCILQLSKCDIFVRINRKQIEYNSKTLSIDRFWISLREKLNLITFQCISKKITSTKNWWYLYNTINDFHFIDMRFIVIFRNCTNLNDALIKIHSRIDDCIITLKLVVQSSFEIFHNYLLLFCLIDWFKMCSFIFAWK